MLDELLIVRHVACTSRRDTRQRAPILSLCAGDKPRSFVGSRNWIGAIELGYVLDARLGVMCKVLTVASGADMPSKARELAHHFDTQACPSLAEILNLKP